MADLTKMFENAFGKFELMKSNMNNVHNENNVSTKIMPENNNAVFDYNASLYPEKIGRKKREERENLKNEYENFLNSMTEDEFNNLLMLSRDRLLLTKGQLIAMGENGEDLQTERLEKAGCIKREKIPDDDIIQFSITANGRKLLNEMKKRLGR